MTITDKAYIVANKKQELDVLNKFEKDGLKWRGNRNPTEFFPSNICLFPIVLFKGDCITWSFSVNLNIEEIVYDGRKEEKMYKVTQEFMDGLIKWRDEYTKSVFGVNAVSLTNMPEIVRDWRFEYNSSIETNKRFGAIINWINGEDVFEVEATHKFIVRSDDIDEDGDYWYVKLYKGLSHISYNSGNATKFDTREEAQEWANSHQVILEIDEDGNKVD